MEDYLLDKAVVRHIFTMNQAQLVDFLQKEYGGTKISHSDWLKQIARNEPRQYFRIRLMRKVTVARIARTRGVENETL
jgi:hypothetical protein